MKKIVIAMLFTIFFGCQNQTFYEEEVNKNDDLLEFLLIETKSFLDEKPTHTHQDINAVLKNQNSQKPFAVIVTCSDSRVSPEILFDQGIGDLFVIRNAGNLISDIDMGSIEYAIEHLDTKLIIVLGHTECGAIKAYLGDKKDDYKKHLSHKIKTIANENEQKKIKKPKDLNSCIIANIMHSKKS
ncbi:MAG: carbonic anhydrase [Flavobacterium sp.]|nr:carbonic anhydrase [Flavobacterium sp.]